MNRQKLWIDTDIGADVDDAIALSLAAHSPHIELLAAKEPYAHCLMYGPELEEARFAPDNRLPCAESGEEAVDAIIRAAETYGEELALLAIGPLTNLARAVRKAPAVMTKIGRIVIMGGAHFTAEPEWNVFCDPEAAKVVYEAGLPLWCVGLDVTRKTRLPQRVLDDLLALHEDSERGYLADFVRAWVARRHVGVTLHDPLALYAFLSPEWLFFKKQRIFVETAGEMTRGFTVNMALSGLYGGKDRGAEVFVAADVCEAEVLRHCLDAVFGIKL